MDRSTPKEEIMRAVEFAQLQAIAEGNGRHRFISMLNYYNLLYLEKEREMTPFCDDTIYGKVGFIPWSPVARRKLTRPYKAGESDRENVDSYFDDLAGITR